MEPNPYGKKNQSSDLASSAEPNPADSQAMSKKRSYNQAIVEPATALADQSTADAAIDSLAGSEKKSKSNRHSSWMWSNDQPHHGWKASYVAMTKCDYCSLASRGVVHQCDECKTTICKECHDAGKLDADKVHHIAPGTVNWDVPEKTKVAATSSRSGHPRPRGGGTRGRGTNKRGGLQNRAPYKNPAFSIRDQVGALEMRPFEGTAAGPWTTSRKDHKGEDNHNGTAATSFRQIEQPPGATFQFRYPYPSPPLLSTSSRPEVGVHAASTASAHQGVVGNAPAFRFEPAESSHAHDENNRHQDQGVKIEATDRPTFRRGVHKPTAWPTPYQRENGHRNGSQTAPRAHNDLTAYSRANQSNTSFAEYHQPIEAPLSKPGVQLPSIDVLFRTIPHQSQLAAQPAPKPYVEPIRPRKTRGRPTSPTASAWGSDLVFRTLEISKALPAWGLDLCLRHEVSRA